MYSSTASSIVKILFIYVWLMCLGLFTFRKQSKVNHYFKMINILLEERHQTLLSHRLSIVPQNLPNTALCTSVLLVSSLSKVKRYLDPPSLVQSPGERCWLIYRYSASLSLPQEPVYLSFFKNNCLILLKYSRFTMLC